MSDKDAGVSTTSGAKVASDRAVRAVRGVVYGLAAALLGITLLLVVRRFVYPTEGEWMTGAMREGIERVRDGKPLYGPPSASFIPFVYPPLFFWASAMLAKVVSSFVAGKVVSIVAALGTGAGVVRIARALGATAAWSRLALVLHLCSYSLTILFYDLERVDALYAAISVVALAVLFARPSTRSDVVAGGLLGLAFFAKQAGLFTFVATVAGLLLAGERRRAAVVLAAGVAVLGGLAAYLELSTNGWFAYYCWKLPRTHGLRPQRVSIFFIVDMPKAFLFSAASLAFGVPALAAAVRALRGRAARPPWQEIVFASVLGASMAAAFSFRAHSGGWQNVLIAWLPFGAVAFPVVATRAEAWAQGSRLERVVTMTLLGAVGLQILGSMFDPLELSPNADDYAERQRLIALVRELEKEGPVLVTTTGKVSAETGVHAAALWDVLRAGDSAPADLLDGIRSHKYAAIFVGVPDELHSESSTYDDLEALLVRHYFVGLRRHERPRNGMTGFDGRPRWGLRPRKHPLPEAPKEELFIRMNLEKAFAEMRASESDMDAEPMPYDEIEAMGEREMAARARR
jgi:hypothetical protein